MERRGSSYVLDVVEESHEDAASPFRVAERLAAAVVAAGTALLAGQIHDETAVLETVDIIEDALRCLPL